MAATTAVRAGTTIWQLDPTHSSVEFSVKHMMMTTVRGRFKDLKATLTGDRDHPDDAGVEAAIDTASIDTGVSEYQGRGTDPWGKTRAGFSFRTEIDRREWGLKWNQAIETGGVLVANKVRIEGEVQFVRQDG